MAALKGQRIQGQGNSEDDWAASQALQALPQTTLEGLMGHCTRLVVVAPHPDDEVLGCGGLMASAIDAGYGLDVVSLTDGEAAYPGDPGWPAARLGPARRVELRHAVLALGGDPERIAHAGLGDGQLGARLAEALAALDRLSRQDAVLVTWACDGHPDHEAAAEAARMACARSGARLVQYPVWAWHWADPRAAAFLRPGAVRLPLSQATLARKRAAIAAFRTQTGQASPAPAAPILPARVLSRFLRPYEVYLT